MSNILKKVLKKMWGSNPEKRADRIMDTITIANELVGKKNKNITEDTTNPGTDELKYPSMPFDNMTVDELVAHPESARDTLESITRQHGIIGEDSNKEKVNHPNHYQIPELGIEVMDLIKYFTKDLPGDQGYLLGNVIKYILRAEKKNGLEDYKKARNQLDELIKLIEDE